jgi:hypothetical protein
MADPEEHEDTDRISMERERENWQAELKDYRDFRLKSKDQRLTMIGLAATAIIGVAGTITTLIVALVQMDNSADQLKAQFTREQQIKAYSAFLTATDEFESAQLNLMTEMGKCREHVSVTTLPSFKAFEDAYYDVRQQVNVVSIVGSQDTQIAGLAIFTRIANVEADTLQVCLDLGKTPSDESSIAKARVAGLGPSQTKFTDAARADLGLG